MKINGKSPSAMQNAMQSQNAESTKAARSGQADGLLETKKAKGLKGEKSIGGSARVDVSARAQDMAKAKALATPTDSIDEAKVARLQKLIDEGKYSVDAEAIADRMLDEYTKMPT